jgi:hypothetical protein
MELRTLDDLYYANDLKETVSENPFELGRFLVLFMKLYNKTTFNITKGPLNSTLSLSDHVSNRIRRLNELLGTTRISMPDIQSMLGHDEITKDTNISIHESSVVDAIVSLHLAQVNHELAINSLEASVKFERNKEDPDFEAEKVVKLDKQISNKKEERVLMINYLKNIAQSLQNHIENHLEPGLFTNDEDVSVQYPVTTEEAYEPVQEPRRSRRKKKPDY